MSAWALSKFRLPTSEEIDVSTFGDKGFRRSEADAA
jgi:hypothetical protein